jgi:hypothetical protein
MPVILLAFIPARAARRSVRHLIGGLHTYVLEAGDRVVLHAYKNLSDASPHAFCALCYSRDAKR